MLEHYCGDLLSFSHKIISEIGTDVGRLELAHSRCSNSSQRCSMELRSGLCADQSSSFTPISKKNISVWALLCARGHCHAETGKGLPQTVATMLRAQRRLEYAVCCIANISLHWNLGAWTMKNSPRPLYLLHQTLQSALHIWTGSFPPNPDLSVRLPNGFAWFTTPENVFPLLQSPMAASFTPGELYTSPAGAWHWAWWS